MISFWEYSILNNPIKDWLLTFGIFLGSVLILRIVRSVIVKRLVSFSKKTKSTFDDLLIAVLGSSIMPLLYVLAFYFSLQYLGLSEKWRSIEHVAVMMVTTFFVIKGKGSYNLLLGRD